MRRAVMNEVSRAHAQSRAAALAYNSLITKFNGLTFKNRASYI